MSAAVAEKARSDAMAATIERRAAGHRLVPLLKRFSDLSLDDVWDFCRNVHLERRLCGLLPDEEARLFDVKCGFGNLGARFAYYRQMYCRPLLRSVRAVFGRFENPRILDAGCGTGTQAILFGLLGASVVAVDRDEGQLRTMRKRVAYYEKVFRDRPAVWIEQADLCSCDFSRWAPLDAVYSHLAIGHVLSAEETFRRLAPWIVPGGLLIMKNSNPRCLWLRAAGVKPDTPSRREYLRSARQHGFAPLVARGATGIPRPLWVLGDLLRIPDAFLRRLGAFQVNIEYIFERT